MAWKFVVEQSRNLTTVIGMFTTIGIGLYSVGLMPITNSMAEDMVEQAIKENNEQWEKKLDQLQRTVTGSAANNSSKILKNQQELQNIERSMSAIDERTQITLDILKELNRKVD